MAVCGFFMYELVVTYTPTATPAAAAAAGGQRAND